MTETTTDRLAGLWRVKRVYFRTGYVTYSVPMTEAHARINSRDDHFQTCCIVPAAEGRNDHDEQVLQEQGR